MWKDGHLSFSPNYSPQGQPKKQTPRRPTQTKKGITNSVGQSTLKSKIKIKSKGYFCVFTAILNHPQLSTIIWHNFYSMHILERLD
jgi:hypothetical protein